MNDRAYAVEGFGEAVPPQMSPISHYIGGFAADIVGKDKFFGGHSPSKPPAKGRLRNSCYLRVMRWSGNIVDRSLGQPGLLRKQPGLDPIAQIELAEDAADVVLYSADAKRKARADLLVGAAAAEHA